MSARFLFHVHFATGGIPKWFQRCLLYHVISVLHTSACLFLLLLKPIISFLLQLEHSLLVFLLPTPSHPSHPSRTVLEQSWNSLEQSLNSVKLVKLWEAELIHFWPQSIAESSCFFFPFSNSSLLSSSWEQLRVCSPLLAALPSEANPNSPWSRSSECLSAHREEKENGSAGTECHSIWILLIFLPDHQGHNRLWHYGRCTMSMWLCLCLLQKLLHHDMDMAH